ncbi:unnamed protein product [Orchesella dallaii]|uniref:Uncharacterized protein n=1 Tax=Orchesella dallaii TaxID=48710 RepID=A0ABP1QUY6_9HEXA
MPSTSLNHFQPNTTTTSLLLSIFLTLSNQPTITMNSFAVVFAALIITVSGSSLRAGRQGWSAPLPPVAIDVELAAAGAAAGAGAADSSIDVYAVAVGGPDVPAEVNLAVDSIAAVQQEVNILEAVNIDLANGPTSTSVNDVNAGNLAAASESVSAFVIGQESAYLAEAGADSAGGVGQVSVSASSTNTQIGG